MSDNIKTVLYAAVMTLIVAISLAFITSFLRPTQKAEENKDKKVNILKAVEFNDFMDVDEEYAKRIQELVVDYNGKVVEGKKAFDVDVRKESKNKPAEERMYPLYVYTNDAKEKKYILPMIGLGLWDEISGFMALKGDFNTIDGAVFAHKAETPGLGAEITTDWFQSQFRGKKLMDAGGKMIFNVLKGRGNTLDQYEVDGITGATITCVGVDNMIAEDVASYANFFKSESKKLSVASGGKSVNPALKNPTVTRMAKDFFKIDKVRIANQINFHNNSSFVTENSFPQIQALVAYLNNNPEKRVKIKVNNKNNGELSQRRSENIYDYALQQGARIAQLEFEGTSEKNRNNNVVFELLN